MVPEWAKRREADKRSDGWAFGAVLYEMRTGQHSASQHSEECLLILAFDSASTK